MAKLMNVFVAATLSVAVASLLVSLPPAVAQSKQAASLPAAPGAEKKTHRLSSR